MNITYINVVWKQWKGETDWKVIDKLTKRILKNLSYLTVGVDDMTKILFHGLRNLPIPIHISI